MQIQQFTLYDVIADIVPGGTALIVFYSVSLGGSTFQNTNPIFVGGILLLGGFFVGRIGHSLGSLGEKQYGDSESSSSFETPEDCPQPIVRAVELELSNRLSALNQDEESENEEESVKADGGENCGQFDVHTKRKYGESILYGEHTLYRKYEMLSTFFRNSLVLGLFVGVYVLGITVIDQFQFQIFIVLGVIIGFSLSLMLYGWCLFSRRSETAFFLDLYDIFLKEKQSLAAENSNNTR